MRAHWIGTVALLAALAVAAPAFASPPYEQWLAMVSSTPYQQAIGVMAHDYAPADVYAYHGRLLGAGWENRDCLHTECEPMLTDLLGRAPTYLEFVQCNHQTATCDATRSAHFLWLWDRGGVSTAGWSYTDWRVGYYRVAERRSEAVARAWAGTKTEPREFAAWCLARATAASCTAPSVTPPPPPPPPPDPACSATPACLAKLCPPPVVCPACPAPPRVEPVPAWVTDGLKRTRGNAKLQTTRRFLDRLAVLLAGGYVPAVPPTGSTTTEVK